MKQKFSIARSIGWVALAVMAAGCSKENGAEPGQEADPSTASVSLEMSYTLQDAPGIAGVEIAWPVDAENSESVEVRPGETWTRTVTYEGIPDFPVGMYVSPMFEADIAAGTAVSYSYTMDCGVTLMDGDGVIDRKVVSRDELFEIEDTGAEDADFSDRCFFTVTARGVSECTGEVADDNAGEELPLPEEDADEVKGLGTLYYFSQADDAVNEDYLFDNFLARFADRRRWDGNPVPKGSFLFLHGNDIEKATGESLRRSLDNGAILVLDALSDYSVLDGFCREMEIYNPMGEGRADVNHAMFILADADSPLAISGEGDYNGLFFMLTPDSDEEGILSDYEQGLIIDSAVTVINGILSAQGGSVRSRAMDDDLQKLTGATKIYLNVNQTLSDSDYQKPSKAKKTQTNSYSVEYDVWNVFSMEEKRNYYYIHQQVTCSFKSCAKDTYNSNVTTNGCRTIAKVLEWYGDEVTLVTEPLETPGMIIHRNSPETTESSTTYESGISWNLGGEVGFIGKDPTGSVNIGISLNSSYSYTIQDVTVSNNVVPGSTLEWSFKFAEARVTDAAFHVALTKIIKGALVGQTSFNGGTDYIISFPESDKAPRLKGSLKVTLRRTCGKAGKKCHVGTKSCEDECVLTLPYLRSSQFAGK